MIHNTKGDVIFFDTMYVIVFFFWVVVSNIF